MNDKYAPFFNTETLKGNMKQRAIQGGMITSASQGFLFLLGLASTIILARMLIPEHFGLIGMVTALTVIIERFEDLGLGDAIVQRKDITHEQVSTLFWLNLGVCASLTIALATSAQAIAWFYNDQRLVWITIAFASNFVCSGLSIQHQALIRRRMRFDQFALIKVISALFGLFIGIILAWQGFGYWALVWKELSRSILSTILAWSFCPWRPGLPVRNSGVKSMLRFGGAVTGYRILYSLSNHLDFILIGKFCGAVPVGLYSRAKQLTASPVGQLLEPMRYVALPTLSPLQNDPIKYRNYFEKMLAVLSFLYMPLVVYIGVYSQPIVYIALGSQWMDVVPLFRLLAVSIFMIPIIVLLGMVMLSSGETKRYFLWGLVTNILTITAFAVGIQWGVIGVAVSWPIATTVNLIFSLFFALKGSPITIGGTLRNIYRPTIASAIMGLVLILTYPYLSSTHIALQIALSIILGVVSYLCVWMFFPGSYHNIILFASYPLSVFKRKKETDLSPQN
jgi:PST family polysaccharide transporter